MARATTQNESDPVRCAGCRREGRAEDLERLVFHESVGLLFDMRGGAPGESVWVHPLPGCIGPACWAGFARELDRSIEVPDAEDLVDSMRDGIRRRVVEQLTDAARLDEIFVGHNAIERNASPGALELVLVAEGTESRAAWSDAQWNILEDVPRAVLETSFRGDVDVVGMPSGSRAERIGRDVEKLFCLTEDDGGGKRG